MTNLVTGAYKRTQTMVIAVYSTPRPHICQLVMMGMQRAQKQRYMEVTV